MCALQNLGRTEKVNDKGMSQGTASRTHRKRATTEQEIFMKAEGVEARLWVEWLLKRRLRSTARIVVADSLAIL